jgi:hypothetical protein
VFYPEVGSYRTSEEYKRPVACTLRVKTQPDTGVDEIPLVIYHGLVDVSGNQLQSLTADEEMIHEEEKANATKSFFLDNDDLSWNRRPVIGFDKLVDWFLNTKTGSALQLLLRRSDGKSDLVGLLAQYLRRE